MPPDFRALRDARGESRDVVALATGVSAKTIQRLEEPPAGWSPRVATLEAVLAYFGIVIRLDAASADR